MQKTILGIDPGLSGGWAVVTQDARLVNAGAFATRQTKKNGKQSTQLDGAAIAATLKATNASHAFVEAVSSRPRQAGQFQFGINTGIIHGILYANQTPFELVAPAVWKSGYGIKRSETETKRDKKNEARHIASALFPNHAYLFQRVKDDGVAEATLIALYGIYILSQR